MNISRKPDPTNHFSFPKYFLTNLELNRCLDIPPLCLLNRRNRGNEANITLSINREVLIKKTVNFSHPRELSTPYIKRALYKV